MPYGVIGEYSWKGNEPHNRELTGNLYDELKSSWSSTEDSKFIPYLRPMESMMEEEYREFGYDVLRYTSREFDWLNKKHFDYRGLIEKDLSIEAPKDLYK